MVLPHPTAVPGAWLPVPGKDAAERILCLLLPRRAAGGGLFDSPPGSRGACSACRGPSRQPHSGLPHSAGRGGHGGTPQVIVDSVVAASAAVMNLQPLVSRETDPVQGAVLGVTRMNSGQAGRGMLQSWGDAACSVQCRAPIAECSWGSHLHQLTPCTQVSPPGDAEVGLHQERVRAKHACARCSLDSPPQLQQVSIAPRHASSCLTGSCSWLAWLLTVELPSTRTA